MKKFAKALAAIMLTVAVVITAGCNKKSEDPEDPEQTVTLTGMWYTGDQWIGNEHIRAAMDFVNSNTLIWYGTISTNKDGFHNTDGLPLEGYAGWYYASKAYYTYVLTENKIIFNDQIFTIFEDYLVEDGSSSQWKPWDNGNGGGGVQTYTITATTNPTNGGMVIGSGTYQEGQQCTLIATANSGYDFVNWTEDGTEVSSDLNYTFAVNANRNLVANFQVQTPQYTISVTANPNMGGVVSGGGLFLEGSTCTVTATPNADYSFTNWTENGIQVSPLQSYFFIVHGNRTLVANFTYDGGGSGDEDYVDLGLPSGLLWATRNVGASSPEEYGDYYAWGETQMKSRYDWSTYQHCMGSRSTLTKYCNVDSYGYNGFTDNLTVLLPEDDAAIANLGSGWRMPTRMEWQELLDNCTLVWTTQNGVNGMRFTGHNGNTLFLPAAGQLSGSGFDSVGSFGNYWTSSLYIDNNPSIALSFFFNSSCYMYNDIRYVGHTVRAVREN